MSQLNFFHWHLSEVQFVHRTVSPFVEVSIDHLENDVMDIDQNFDLTSTVVVDDRRLLDGVYHFLYEADILI